MKPFTTSLLGSMPRSQALLMARKKHALGKITTTELEQIVVQETKQIVALILSRVANYFATITFLLLHKKFKAQS